MKSIRLLLLLLLVAVLVACGDSTATKQKVVGMILVGPINDGGWSQAHYEGMQQAAKEQGWKFVYVDKVNLGDRPNVKVEQVADELIGQGASVVIANSDDFKDGIREAAKAHPEVTFVHVSGDDVWSGKAPANLSNMMGQMEYGKMMAGCAAALASNTGKIQYLGPLLNDETRRLANSAYLGARHCWTTRGNDVTKLEFTVTWIGFWFNRPGNTLDPTKVVNDAFTNGADVVISGIDTPEAIVEAAKARAAGKDVYAVPYDHESACQGRESACLGVPYFNWYPEYTKLLIASQKGTFTQQFILSGPNWNSLNDRSSSTIGFAKGPALKNESQFDAFVATLQEGSLFVGPLNYQDGSSFLAAGEKADDKKIWYQGQLLEGMLGQSK